MPAMRLLFIALLLFCTACSAKDEERRDTRARSVGLPRLWLIHEDIHGRVVDAESCADLLASPGPRPDYSLCVPIPGAEVELSIASGAVIEKARSDADGRFFFPRRTRRQIMSYDDSRDNAFTDGAIRVYAPGFWLIEAPASWKQGYTEALVRRTNPSPYNPPADKRHIAVILGPERQ